MLLQLGLILIGVGLVEEYTKRQNKEKPAEPEEPKIINPTENIRNTKKWKENNA